jgi:hypothetical protein
MIQSFGSGNFMSKHGKRLRGIIVVAGLTLSMSACDRDDGASIESGPAPPPRMVYTPSERRAVRTDIEPTLREIDIEIERLADEIESNGKKAFAESHRRNLRDLRRRIDRVRARMEEMRPDESALFRETREQTNARLKRYEERIERLIEGVGTHTPKPASDESDAGQGA